VYAFPDAEMAVSQYLFRLGLDLSAEAGFATRRASVYGLAISIRRSGDTGPTFHLSIIQLHAAARGWRIRLQIGKSNAVGHSHWGLAECSRTC
jgi:hypothetical protein